MSQLNGKIALITGGGRGLGRAIALAYADAGADVVVASRQREHLDQVVNAIRAKSRRAIAVQVEVSDPASVAQMVEQTRNEFGRVDILVNSAGMGWDEKLTAMSDESWNQVIATNLSGTFYACRDVARVMIEQKSGNIINLASIMGAKSAPGLGAYSASKAGIIALTKTLALETARHNVRVNAIAPGYFRTDMNSAALDDPAIGAKIIGRIPLRRAGKPEEIGGLAVYLASDDASFVTGEIYFISGGETAQ
jgi:2-deoxy-D-gluconate 3-dehydrogenase